MQQEQLSTETAQHRRAPVRRVEAEASRLPQRLADSMMKSPASSADSRASGARSRSRCVALSTCSLPLSGSRSRPARGGVGGTLRNLGRLARWGKDTRSRRRTQVDRRTPARFSPDCIVVLAPPVPNVAVVEATLTGHPACQVRPPGEADFLYPSTERSSPARSREAVRDCSRRPLAPPEPSPYPARPPLGTDARRNPALVGSPGANHRVGRHHRSRRDPHCAR